MPRPTDRDNDRPDQPSATAISAGVRAGDQEPAAALDRSLRRIDERDVGIGAFVGLRADEARADAAALTSHPERRSLPLAGVPVAIKDIVDVAGLPTRIGSGAVTDGAAAWDAEVVRRLRSAGAIIVGKTTLPELGVWATTDGATGVTRNPRSPERTAGGSSGGSGAAVGAGMVPLALGTDGLGSIRIPAAACGVVGFKPGAGVVPRQVRGGDWHGMAEAGPLGTTVADVALATSVLADRPTLAGADVQKPLLIALSTRTPLPGGAIDPEWEAAAHEVGRKLRRAGHRVVEDDPPYSPLYALPVLSRWFAGVAAAAEELGADLEPRRLQRRTRTHIRLGRLVHRMGGPWEALRTRWREAVGAFFGGYDALITPALAFPPIGAHRWSRRGWLRNMRSNMRYAPFAAPWNLSGSPAGVVPTGMHSDGTPVAVQVVAAASDDAGALALMRAVERVS